MSGGGRRVKNMLLLGALTAGSLVTIKPAAAKTYAFGFYTSSGSAFCDGVKFTGDKLGGAGFHVYDQVNCKYPDGILGGFAGRTPALGPGNWYTFPVSQAQGDLTPPSFTPVFYINVKALSWVAAYESTDYNVPFQVLNGGILMKGKPAAMAKPGQKNLGAVLRQTLVSLRK